MQNCDRLARIHVKRVHEEVVRLHDIDAIRSERGGRKIFHVCADNLIYAAAHRGCQNMPVFRLAGHRRNQAFIAGDLPISEVLAQRGEATANPILITSLGDQIALCFVKNRFGPAHRTHIALSESDRAIQQRNSVNDVRVEQNREPRN